MRQDEFVEYKARLLYRVPNKIREITARGNVRVEGDAFVFANGYTIAFDCVNADGWTIIGWLWHMNKKTWWTPEVQADFIQFLILFCPDPSSGEPMTPRKKEPTGGAPPDNAIG